MRFDRSGASAQAQLAGDVLKGPYIFVRAKKNFRGSFPQLTIIKIPPAPQKIAVRIAHRDKVTSSSFNMIYVDDPSRHINQSDSENFRLWAMADSPTEPSGG